jgi:oligoendopeptidase F
METCMRLFAATALAAASLFVLPAAHAQGDADRWNLAALYPTQSAWDADLARADGQLREVEACKGRLGRSAAQLRQCLDLFEDVAKRISRLYVYASQQLAEDTRAPASLSLLQRVQTLASRAGEAASFREPEILRIGAERVRQFVAQDPGLRVHRYPLERILRRAPHTLDERGEALVAGFDPMTDAGQDAYSMLTNADLPWPRVKLSTGEEVAVDPTGYTRHREAPDRADRKRVMDAFFGTFKTYERTMGVLLHAQMKQDKVFAKVRRYPDSITAVLDRSHVPVAVYDTLIAQAREHLPTLHRYFRLRARLLGIADMQYHDIYPPLVRGDAFRFPLEQAKQLTLESVAPLGADYGAGMRQGFRDRWMDAYPRPGKQSGAHVAGTAYDVHPMVLMNYADDYSSLTTLAHEWGHALHSWLSNRTQPWPTSRYTIFTAEIASTFNEVLLLDRMLKAARTDDERLFYLGAALENMRATFFRQAMFAEFEREAHARVDRGEPMTGQDYSRLYCEILRRHHGTAQGVMAVDDSVCAEWAYIPHFYGAFYVYQYATSIAASSLLAQRVLDQEPGALARYLDLLRAGGSDDAYELVKRAGVDLATAAPYRSLMARMNRVMDEMDSILARRR